LEEAARAAGRTLHAEIISRLEASFVDHSSPNFSTSNRSELRQLVIEELETFLTVDRLHKLLEEKEEPKPRPSKRIVRKATKPE
jgi:hypothetical protein